MVKGEEIMPVPGGEITTTELWQQPVNSAEELDAVIDELIAESDAQEELVQDDLPELS